MNIKLENVKKRFGETTAIDDISLEFHDGKLTTLLGPSGCGKSTMLNLISGILPVTEGKIYFGDRDVTDLSPDKRNIGLVFQNYALYPHMKVWENIAFPLEIKKVPKKERKERAYEFAKLLRIEEYFERRPSQLSGGQQQRVAIARALAKEPGILLLDEPLSNLDARLRLEMREEIRRIQLETGITTVFVTHDQEEALSISDYIVLMKKGEIQQCGLPQELYDEPENVFVADFLGNPPINLVEAVVSEGRAVSKGGAAFRTDSLSRIPEGKSIILGIRSESFAVCREEDPAYKDSTPALVKAAFMNGKDVLYSLEIGNMEMRAGFSGDKIYKAGDRLNVILKKKGVHIYDYDTGEKIG